MKIPPFDSVKQYLLIPIDSFRACLHGGELSELLFFVANFSEQFIFSMNMFVSLLFRYYNSLKNLYLN
jgi:hypothetical protein